MSEKSVEQVVRDILQAAYEAELFSLDGEWQGTEPQQLSSGDLVGPANVLEEFLKDVLAENERLKATVRQCAIVSGSMGGTLEQQDTEMDESFVVDPDSVPQLVVSRVESLYARIIALEQQNERLKAGWDTDAALCKEYHLQALRLEQQVAELRANAERWSDLLLRLGVEIYADNGLSIEPLRESASEVHTELLAAIDAARSR